MLGAFVQSIPFISDALNEHLLFSRKITAVRGLYPSREAAETAIARRGERMGFDEFSAETTDRIAQLTAAKELDAMEPREYPVLWWLRTLLRPCESVFNIGGNVGLDYYAYSGLWPELAAHPWLVCETPRVAAAGAALAVERGADNLRFTSDIEDGDGADAVVCVGALQYLPYDLAGMVAGWGKPPRFLILAIFPAISGGGSFWTVQNIGYASVPYQIFDLQALEAAFVKVGYRRCASWAFPRAVSIPFHPKKRVDSYHGCVFVRADENSAP